MINNSPLKPEKFHFSCKFYHSYSFRIEIKIESSIALIPIRKRKLSIRVKHLKSLNISKRKANVSSTNLSFFNESEFLIKKTGCFRDFWQQKKFLITFSVIVSCGYILHQKAHSIHVLPHVINVIENWIFCVRQNWIVFCYLEFSKHLDLILNHCFKKKTNTKTVKLDHLFGVVR